METNNRNQTQELLRAWPGAMILSGGQVAAAAATMRVCLDWTPPIGFCFGTLFLANPDLVERLKRRADLNAADDSTFYGGGAEGYTDYPTLDPRS